MELVKDIYFNTDKLIENTKIKVSYTGKFYQGNSDKVYLHYGYGKDWDNVNDIEMTKTDLGYQAEINLMSSDTLNFCFKNQNNEWDNNFGKNYIFGIEKPAILSEQRNPSLVFLGKSFGNKIETSSNIFWSSNNSEITEQNNYPIIGDNALNSSPNSYDTVLPKTNNVISANFGETTESISSDDVIHAVEICAEPSVETTVETTTENAIALAPTRFNYWTRKIKTTVCKFFSYVPKLISGNYKRNLAKNKEQ